jgi:chromosome transmission fidelity protein 4
LGYIPTVASNGDGDDEDAEPRLSETQLLEQSYALNSTLLSLLTDLVENTRPTASTKVELAKKTLDVDKSLLQLLAAECREGEDRGMKAMEIVGLMKDGSGKMIDASVKVARRYNQSVLAERIQELAERRAVGLDEDEE